MATPTRALLTRVCIPTSASAASSLRRRRLPNHNQNDTAAWTPSVDVQRIRDDVKRYKIQDEVLRENLAWDSWFYKTLEWSSYVVLSVSAAGLTACEVIARSRRKDKGHVQTSTT